MQCWRHHEDTRTRGALIGIICLDDYDIPPLLLCARQVRSGLPSLADQHGLDTVFEEQVRKAGWVG